MRDTGISSTPGQRGPDLIGALGGSVNDQPAVGFHVGHAGHGFQETLVDALGAVHLLHDHVRIPERLVDVAAVGVKQRADVVPQGEPVSLVLFQIGMHRRRARTNGGQRIHHRRQVFVLDLDEFEGFLRRGFVVRGHRGDGFADEVDHVARHDVPIPQRARAVPDIREIGSRDDAPNAGMGFRLAGVQPDDPGVVAGAGQQFAGQHPRQIHVGRIGGAAGDLIVSIDARDDCAPRL